MNASQFAKYSILALTACPPMLFGVKQVHAQQSSPAANSSKSDSHWQEQFARELPRLGHRNWIVIADSAYPAQSNPGIKTVYTGASHLDVVREVLKALDASKHVNANVYLDKELSHVDEKDAQGVQALRESLAKTLKGRKVETLPHEDVIRKLDESAKLFNVLILKTDLALPYTSVFLELDCGYWSADREKRLRSRIAEETK